ncbi:threonine/serine exporter family protein, partial [Mycobacterium tuberculosis]|nr:threonine/serine exporter family protein [Mycobacterium tuberculosis]
TLRASTTHAINASIIVQIQRIVLDLESMPVTSTLEHATYRFDEIVRDTYPAKMVAPMVGVACACFAYLAGGDILVCLVTFIASMMGYSLR